MRKTCVWRQRPEDRTVLTKIHNKTDHHLSQKPQALFFSCGTCVCFMFTYTIHYNGQHNLKQSSLIHLLSFDLLMFTMRTVKYFYYAEDRWKTCWCSSRFGVDSGSMEVSVCWLTTQAVHLLLLQQTDSVLLSIQYQLHLRVLAGQSLAAEHFLQLDHLVLVINCQQMQSRRETTLYCALPSGSERMSKCFGSAIYQ